MVYSTSVVAISALALHAATAGAIAVHSNGRLFPGHGHGLQVIPTSQPPSTATAALAPSAAPPYLPGYKSAPQIPAKSSWLWSNDPMMAPGLHMPKSTYAPGLIQRRSEAEVEVEDLLPTRDLRLDELSEIARLFHRRDLEIDLQRRQWGALFGNLFRAVGRKGIKDAVKTGVHDVLSTSPTTTSTTAAAAASPSSTTTTTTTKPSFVMLPGVATKRNEDSAGRRAELANLLRAHDLLEGGTMFGHGFGQQKRGPEVANADEFERLLNRELTARGLERRAMRVRANGGQIHTGRGHPIRPSCETLCAERV